MEESQKDTETSSVEKTAKPSDDASESSHPAEQPETKDKVGQDASAEQSSASSSESTNDLSKNSVEDSTQVDKSSAIEQSPIEPNSAQMNTNESLETQADAEQSAVKAAKQSASVKETTVLAKSPSRWRWLVTIAAIVLLAVVFALVGAWLNQRELALAKKTEALVAVQQTQQKELAEANRRIEAFQASMAGMESSLVQRMGGSSKQAASLANRIDNAEKRIAAQNKRLLSMSTTSREDWLLAEAEYLLRLANQRVLVERSADSAIGLLREADAILYGLDDPDLKPLRSAISDDLVALGLVETIDVEGIYIELNSLAKKVESLPLITDDFGSSASDQASAAAELQTGSETELPADNGLLSTASNSVSRFFSGLKDYVRVIDHADKPVAILPPDATAYLHMNLRLIIERAQLALLREQQNIYHNSLSEAEQWVERYFHTDKATFYVKRFGELKQKQVVKNLPDITGSLELLKSYIEALHKVKSVATPQASAANSGSGASTASRGEQ